MSCIKNSVVGKIKKGNKRNAAKLTRPKILNILRILSLVHTRDSTKSIFQS